MLSLRPLADSHVHFSDHRQIRAFAEYIHAFNLEAVGIVSLPDFHRMNFNPEAIYGKLVAPALVDELVEGDKDNRFNPFSDVAPEVSVFAFGGLDYSGLVHQVADVEVDFAAQLRELHAIGFDGIKMWAGKPHFQARTGLPLHGAAYGPLFHEAGRLGMPVVIHVADPPLFWRGQSGGINAELGIRYDAPGVPSFEELQRQAAAICAVHGDTTFIFPHLLFRAGDLPSFYTFMHRYPNAVLDLAPGLYFYAELYRRYEDARSFFHTFRHRILFGSDGFWFPGHRQDLPRRSPEENAEGTRRLLRFLTSDAVFENPFEPTRAAVPTVTGLRLPEEVLDAVFYDAFEDLMGPTSRPVDSRRLDAYLARFEERLRAIGAPDEDVRGVAEIRAECGRLIEENPT
ncbi:MAG: amidohydrolase family protein [Spirochaetaceae bacterium]